MNSRIDGESLSWDQTSIVQCNMIEIRHLLDNVIW